MTALHGCPQPGFTYLERGPRCRICKPWPGCIEGTPILGEVAPHLWGSHPEMHPIVLEREGEGGGPWGLNSETINLGGKSGGYTSMGLSFWPPSKCLLPSVLGLGPEEWALLYSFSSHLTLA